MGEFGFMSLRRVRGKGESGGGQDRDRRNAEGRTNKRLKDGIEERERSSVFSHLAEPTR